MNGLLSKGLYRKNASASACKTLLKDFKESKCKFRSLLSDPFTFKIMKINDETSNVAADTMRNFFRQLPEPLIPSTVHNMLYRIKSKFLLLLCFTLLQKTFLNLINGVKLIEQF